jgi:hypothetical protein
MELRLLFFVAVILSTATAALQTEEGVLVLNSNNF